MNDAAILAIADSSYLAERLARGEFCNTVVKLFMGHEVDGIAGVQALLGQRREMRSDEGDLERGFGRLHHLCQTDVAVEARRAGEEDYEVVVSRYLDRFIGTNAMRGSIEQPGFRYHSGRIRKPYRIPVRFDFACGRPSRTSTSIKSLEGRGIQQQSFHHRI